MEKILQVMYGHTTDECITFEALFRQLKANYLKGRLLHQAEVKVYEISVSGSKQESISSSFSEKGKS